MGLETPDTAYPIRLIGSTNETADQQKQDHHYQHNVEPVCDEFHHGYILLFNLIAR